MTNEMNVNSNTQVCSLTDKSCIPCQGGTPPLSSEEKSHHLIEVSKIGEGWNLIDEEKKIFKQFKFRNYKLAWTFVNMISEIAEDQGHHPDLTLGWGYVGVTVQTHKIDNLVESDFIFVAKVEKVFQDKMTQLMAPKK